jgi:hypothetical protein
MRELADAERTRAFMRAFGREADRDGACYLTGGATAVLLGWRQTTIDVDLRLVPETDALLRAIQRLKDELRVNVELASPADFIPVPDGWEERSRFEAHEGRLSFYHLIEPATALAYFEQIEPELYRFPALDPRSFRRRVEEAFG